MKHLLTKHFWLPYRSSQDDVFDNKVAFNGLKTLEGKKKKAFSKLAKEKHFQGEEEEIRIIAAVKLVISGYTHRY